MAQNFFANPPSRHAVARVQRCLALQIGNRISIAPVDMLSRPTSILRTIMAAAIRERQLLTVTYSGTTEPQLFAPVALYVSAANRLMLEGYEVKGGRSRWRELELEALRDVRQTLQTFVDLNSDTRISKRYPIGATIIVEASSRPS